MRSGPGGIRVEVLTNQNGGVVFWGWSDNAFDPETQKHSQNSGGLQLFCCEL